MPKCDWMAHGWTKWSADVANTSETVQQQQQQQRGGGYGGRGWSLPSRVRGTADTAANPPLKVVLLVNVGHPQDTYPLPVRTHAAKSCVSSFVMNDRQSTCQCITQTDSGCGHENLKFGTVR